MFDQCLECCSLELRVIQISHACNSELSFTETLLFFLKEIPILNEIYIYTYRYIFYIYKFLSIKQL